MVFTLHSAETPPSSPFMLQVLCDISGLETLTKDRIPVVIPLPGQDYIAGPTLFPARVIAGDHADFAKYTADTWVQHLLNESKKYPTCTVVSSFSAINSGTPKLRYWFGYFFSGPYATPEDFVQASGIEGARAYNLRIPVALAAGE